MCLSERSFHSVPIPSRRKHPWKFPAAGASQTGFGKENQAGLGHTSSQLLPALSNTFPISDPRATMRISNWQLPKLHSRHKPGFLTFPHRHSRACRLTIDQQTGNPLALKSQRAGRTINRNTVLYTENPPSELAAKRIVEKMSPQALIRLAEATGFAPEDIIKYNRLFRRLQQGRGIDQHGLAKMLGHFCKIDPTDEFVSQRLYELNLKGQPMMRFEQVVQLIKRLKGPPGKPPGREITGENIPYTMQNVDLFFDIVDTNQSGQLSMRELQEMLTIRNSDRLDFAKERRKALLANVIRDVYQILEKDPEEYISRDELVNAVGSSDSVRRFFCKGLFMAANLEQTAT